jgi:hypothetical protein
MLAQFINDWGYLAKVESQVILNIQPVPIFIFKAVYPQGVRVPHVENHWFRLFVGLLTWGAACHKLPVPHLGSDQSSQCLGGERSLLLTAWPPMSARHA